MIDFETLTRPASPNTYLVAPEGACAAGTPDRASPVFGAAPSALFEAALAAVRDLKGVSDVTADAAAGAVSAVVRTPLLRFKDDLDLRVVPQDRGAALCIYSRSRVGHSDLGANGKRVAALLAAIQDRLGAPGEGASS